MTASVAKAATFIVPDDREMVRRSDLVVVASALNSYTQIAAYGGIETVTVMSVEEVIKGRLTEREIKVHEPGGVLGNRVKIIPGSPRFTDGDRVLLLLKRTPQGTWSATDLTLGKFAFETDNTGRKLLLRQGDISGWNPDGSVYHERARLADKFLEFVRGEAKGQPAELNYLTSAPVTSAFRPRADALRVQSNAASTSAKSYTTLNGGGDTHGQRWFNFPGAVTFYPYNTSANPTAATNAVNAAIAAWNGDTLSNVNVVNGVTDPGPAAPLGLIGDPDGRNSIRFEVNLAAYGAAHGQNPAFYTFNCSAGSYSGLLGLGGIQTVAPATATHAGETFWSIIEADVDMNQNVLGCALLINTNDLFSAVAHELGHALGFRHSDAGRDGGACTPSTTNECLANGAASIMKSFISNNIAGVLQTWETNAVRAVYAAAACTTPTINTHPANQSVTAGQTATLSVAASGTATLTYQWYAGASGNTASPVGGATAATLQIAPGSTTSYWVRVSNSCGTADSNAATVTVNVPCAAPTITGQPSPSSIVAGSTAHVAVIPSGNAAAVTYQWYIGTSGVTSSPVPGGTTQSINVSPATTTTYWVRVTNACGFVNSTAATVTVTPAVAGRKAPNDFDGDGRTDLIWRHTDGTLAMWEMNIRTIDNGAAFGSLPSNWQIKGYGDFFGDGKWEIVLQNSVDGLVAFWEMDGHTLVNGAAVTPIPAAWKIELVADFNGDGKSDILLRNQNTTEVAMWEMNGRNIVNGSAFITLPLVWKFETAGDFNADGRADLILRNSSTGLVALWEMNGRTLVNGDAITGVPLSWQIQRASGDFNGDGYADLIWRHTDGTIAMWEMNRRTILNGDAFVVLPAEWQIRSAGHFDSDAKSDLFLHNTSTGLTALWQMNGHSITNGAAIGSAPLAWSPQAP